MPDQRTRRVRATTALGVSLAIHAMAAAAFSVPWFGAEPEAPPETIEVALIALPAPTAPREGAPLAEAAPRAAAEPAPLPPPAAVPALADEQAPAAPKPALRLQRERPAAAPSPSVEFRVAIADPRCPQPARDDRPLSPFLEERAVASLRAKRNDLLPPLATEALPGRGFRAAEGQEIAAAAAGPAQAKAPAGGAAQELVFHVHSHGDPGLAARLAQLPLVPADQIGGATGPLVAIIQQRIDRVSPLVHRTSGPCRAEHGLARIRLLLDKRGYPLGYQILGSSGSACLDGQIDTVLHLAEPYPYVAGWIPARVRFTL